MAAPSDNVFFSDLPGEIDETQLQSIFGAYGNISSVKVIPGQGKNSALIRFQTIEEATWIVENLNGNLAQGLATPVQVRFASDAPPGGGGGGGWGGGGGGGKDWGGDRGGGGGGGGWGGDRDRWSPYGGKGGGGGGGGGWAPRGKGGSIRILKKGLLQAGVLPGGRWQNDENALFVGGLPGDTTDLDIYEIFSPFGSIPSGGVKAMCNPDGSCRGIGFVNFLDSSAAQNAIATLNGTMMPDGTSLRVCIKGAPGQRSGEPPKGKGK